MTSIYVATPCYGHQLFTGYMTSYLKTEKAVAAKGHQIELVCPGNESLITRARNNLTAHFMGSKHDVLMFIDSDITWPAEALLDLVESPYDVCGIPYPLKLIDWKKIADYVNKPREEGTRIGANKLKAMSTGYTINELKQTGGPALPKHWHRVSALGTGFLMIRRHVLEKMQAHYREQLLYVNDVGGYREECKPEHCVALFDTMIHPRTRRYLSEDYAFCKRWRDMGGEIYANLAHRLVHTGTASF